MCNFTKIKREKMLGMIFYRIIVAIQPYNGIM